MSSHPRRRVGLRPWTGLVVVCAIALASIGPAGGAPGSLSAAEAKLASATADRVAYDAALRDAQVRHDELAAALDALGEMDAQLTADLAAARRELREFAVAAYIDGGRSEVFRSTLNIEQAQALAWQSSLASGQSTAADVAADKFEVLKAATTPERLAAAEALDRAAGELESARFDAIQAAAHERDAEAALMRERAAAADRAAGERAAAARAAAEQAARTRSDVTSAPEPSNTPAAPTRVANPAPDPLAVVVPAPPPPSPTPAGMGSPSASESATLAKIRRCESGGNYAIVSASGRYRGAYQFDYSTWQSVGGSGDPASAAPAEQDYRALLLLRMRGTRPWPHCGR